MTIPPVWCAEPLTSVGGAWEMELLTERQASSISKRLTASIPIFSATRTYWLQKLISKLNQHQYHTYTPNGRTRCAQKSTLKHQTSKRHF